MREWPGRRYWIVGASEGLGRALAGVMSRSAAELVLSARSEERLHDLAADLPGRARAVPCDVADRKSVERAAAEAGEIDGLVSMPAAYWPMSARDWHPDRVEEMADVNFTGCLRVLGQVVPRMVARGHGHIVLVGSLSGHRGLPRSVGYGASKAAIINLAEGMRSDLEGTGVEVQLVNPGFVRTRLTERNDFRMPGLMEPEQAAREIFEHMNRDSFAHDFPLWFSLAFAMGRVLPQGMWQRLFR
jgi:short-subunit dehydrogenase